MADSETVTQSGRGRPHVVVVGGGIAGLESVLALGDLAGGRAELTLISELPHFEYLPARLFSTVSESAVSRIRDLAAIAERVEAEFLQDRAVSVDPGIRRISLESGREVSYDYAVLCTGSRLGSRFEKAPPLWGDRQPPQISDLIDHAAEHPSRRISLIVPPGVSWTLPIYEVALMTARQVAERGLSVEPMVVTPEAGPLIMFGPTVCDSVYSLLRNRRVSVLPSTYAHESEDGGIHLTPGGDRLDVAAAISLPVHYGPGIAGVPTDSSGFVPIDNHARVRGCTALFAAGDATNFPIKQGGLAAQQADAAAEQIAFELGTLDEPRPFHPVLRGKFLLGEAELFLQADVAGGAGDGTVSKYRLWSPALKVGARYLGPLLAGDDPDEEGALDRPPLDVEVNLSGEWFRDPLSLDPYGPLRHD